MLSNYLGAFAYADAMTIVGLGALLMCLLIAVWHDMRFMRIPNWVVFPGAALALALHTIFPAGIGFSNALLGLAIGLAALLPLYWLRATGAGDVKLMAMVGAFLGPIDTIGALIVTFVVGAVLALLVGLRHRAMGRIAQNVQLIFYGVAAKLSRAGGPAFDPATETAVKVPYAVAIALGTCLFLAIKYVR